MPAAFWKRLPDAQPRCCKRRIGRARSLTYLIFHSNILIKEEETRHHRPKYVLFLKIRNRTLRESIESFADLKREQRSSHRNPLIIPVLAQNADIHIPATVNGTDAPWRSSGCFFCHQTQTLRVIARIAM